MGPSSNHLKKMALVRTTGEFSDASLPLQYKKVEAIDIVKIYSNTWHKAFFFSFGWSY